MSSASSSRSNSPAAKPKQDNYISQFLRRPFQESDNDTPLFYSTLDERRDVGHAVEASGDSMHGLGRDQLITSLNEQEIAEEESPFISTSGKNVKRPAAALLEDSLYSHSEASALPSPQVTRQTTGWRMHQPQQAVPSPQALRPSSSMSNKNSDLSSHFVGQSVMLSSPESNSPSAASHHSDLTRSESDELLSALKAPQIRSDSPPPNIPRFQKPPDQYGDSRPTIHVQQDETETVPQIQAYDSGWLAIYLSCVTGTGVIAIYAYLFANPPYDLTSPKNPLPPVEDTEVEEAASLLSILPLLTSLTLLSILGASSAIGYMMLVQKGVRRMVYGLLIGGPTSLIFLSFWSWGFSWQEEAEQGREARWVCLGAALLAGICVKMTWSRKDKIERTVEVIEVCLTDLLVRLSLIASIGTYSWRCQLSLRIQQSLVSN